MRQNNGHIAAGIDVGTNAVKCCVARLENGRPTILREMRIPARLGEGWTSGGRLTPAAITRTCAAVCQMADAARALGAERVRAAGTSAAREAANTRELAACIRESCGVELEILSGEEEARLAFLAVASLEAPEGGRVAVFDSGGGSTEWACGRDGTLEWARTVPVGAVRLTQEAFRHDPVPPAEAETAVARVAAALRGLPDVSGARLVATGGTAHTMARVHEAHSGLPWERARHLSRAEVDRQAALFLSLTAAERAGIPGVDADRADIIAAGALILRGCLDAAGAGVVFVSGAGVRHGLILDPPRSA